MLSTIYGATNTNTIEGRQQNKTNIMLLTSVEENNTTSPKMREQATNVDEELLLQRPPKIQRCSAFDNNVIAAHASEKFSGVESPYLEGYGRQCYPSFAQGQRISSSSPLLQEDLRMVPSISTSKALSEGGASSSLTEINPRANFNFLPLDVLIHTLSFLGPTSLSLPRLAQLTRYHSSVMKSVGDSMLHQARNSFRKPLEGNKSTMKKQISRKRKLSFLNTTQGEFRDHRPNEDQDIVVEESSISVAVRHARACRRVHERCVLLKRVLDKAFSVESSLSPSSSPLSQRLLQQQNQVSSPHVAATSDEIDYSISLALSLLSNKDPSKISTSSLDLSSSPSPLSKYSSALELRSLALCGKCGGKVFKHAKHMLWSLQQLQLQQRNESNTENDDDDEEEEDAIDVDLNFYQEQEEKLMCEQLIESQQLRLTQSRLIMRLVVHRYMEIARERRLGT
mmetsp:Transcript_6012/g.8937  ORF Transcript_6012/g.8937 Transcript_6012/m.8937 type:complete len:453 (-) Transcript_6012:235-1593(-)